MLNQKLFGGINVIEQTKATNLTPEAQKAWDEAFGEFVGANYQPISYVGSQVVQGINHIFLAQQDLALKEPVRHVAVVTINEFAGTYSVTNIERLY